MLETVAFARFSALAAGRAFDTQTSSGTGTDAETNEEGDRYPEEDGADGQAGKAKPGLQCEGAAP